MRKNSITLPTQCAILKPNHKPKSLSPTPIHFAACCAVQDTSVTRLTTALTPDLGQAEADTVETR